MHQPEPGRGSKHGRAGSKRLARHAVLSPGRAVLLGIAVLLGLAGLLAAIGTHNSGRGHDAATATVTISEKTPLHSVPGQFAGFSIDPANLCHVLELAQTDPAFVQLFKNLGPGTLRVGGNTGDRHASWSAAGRPSCEWHDVVMTPSLVRSFFSFATSVGYRVMWQVPLANDNPGEDAAEAAYVSTMPGLYSIEIGNEPDFYPGAAAEYQKYMSDWSAIYNDYRADGGTAAVTGPAVMTGPLATASGMPDYLAPFLSRDAADISAITVHYYAGSALDNPTCGSLLDTAALRSVVKSDFDTASSYSLPVIMNESNTYVHFGLQGVSNAFCSSLWAADLLLSGLHQGLLGIYLHGTADYAPANSAGQPEYYTPIDDNGSPAPEYYGMLFYREVVPAGGSIVSARSRGVSNLDVYAVRGRDGKLRVALLNRNDAAVTVTLKTAGSYRSASQVSLSAPALNALSGVTLGKTAVEANGTWRPTATPVAVEGSLATVTVPAHTAMVVIYPQD